MHIVGIIVVCWALADFVSGVGHWWEDRYARETWPIVGALVAKPNQDHHRQPGAMSPHYLDRNLVTMALAAFGALVTLAVVGATPWLLAFVFASQANEVHYWAHHPRNVLVRAAQATGIFQSASHHALHHRAPHDVRYCVMSDWLNPGLDLVRFWFALERVIYYATGIRPRAE